MLLFTGNNKHLFTNIATTIKANQSRRALLKALSYVFQIHNLPFFDFRQKKLQEFGIQVIEISDIKTLHTNPPKYEIHQIRYTFRLSKIILRDHSTDRYAAVDSHIQQHGIECLAADILKVNVNAFRKVSDL